MNSEMPMVPPMEMAILNRARFCFLEASEAGAELVVVAQVDYKQCYLKYFIDNSVGTWDQYGIIV